MVTCERPWSSTDLMAAWARFARFRAGITTVKPPYAGGSRRGASIVTCGSIITDSLTLTLCGNRRARFQHIAFEERVRVMGLDPRFGGRGQLRPIAGHEPLRLAPEVLGRLGDEDLVVRARRDPAAAEAGRDHGDAGRHRFENLRPDAPPQAHRAEQG